MRDYYVQFNKYTYIHTYIHTSIEHKSRGIWKLSFSSRCCTFGRTHTSADPIRLLCIPLAIPLSFPLPSRFAPSARLVVCVSPRALRLVCYFSCVCMFWDERGGGTTPVGPQVDTAIITTALSTNRVDLGSFSSRCCTFRRNLEVKF